MHTPTKAQFQKVIDLLYTILPLTFEQKRSLDMAEPKVDRCGHTCGTVHCFAGWFAVACQHAGLLEKHVSYSDGATMMAELLGFESYYFLKVWAETYSDIWGNINGYNMFSEKWAFSSADRPKGAKSVSDIINHLEEVMARLPK